MHSLGDMVHIADLSNYCYFASGPRLRAIGWLEGNERFDAGPVHIAFLARLLEQLKDPFGIVDFLGFHTCSFCGHASAPHGNGELIVPTHEVCFVAPSLIAHYVEVHHYCPPASFVTAVMNCPPQKSPAYMSLVAPFLGELNNVA